MKKKRFPQVQPSPSEGVMTLPALVGSRPPHTRPQVEPKPQTKPQILPLPRPQRPQTLPAKLREDQKRGGE